MGRAFLMAMTGICILGTTSLVNGCSADPPPSAEERFWTDNTNHWSMSFANYDAWTLTNVYPLLDRKDPEARETFRRWYVQIRDLPVEAEYPSEEWCYRMDSKLLLLGGGITRKLTTVADTNCWYAVADVIGSVRPLKRSVEDYLAEFREYRRTNPDWFKTFGRDRARSRRFQSAQAVIEQLDSRLSKRMFETFIGIGVPKIPEPERSVVISNIVRRARMTPEEVRKIDEIINRKNME